MPCICGEEREGGGGGDSDNADDDHSDANDDENNDEGGAHAQCKSCLLRDGETFCRLNAKDVVKNTCREQCSTLNDCNAVLRHLPVTCCAQLRRFYFEHFIIIGVICRICHQECYFDGD